MNICSFTGYLTENPKISIVDDIVLAEFTIVVYNYRRTKSTGEKSRTPTFIRCEAWHTGAETLEKFATKGTKITVVASAKNISKDNKNIIFRINEFDLCHQDFED
ncbi:MAG: single-stranded DNA-binding protein [Proteobacteria bacterium]|nr:single-stranded DNA-binding protein [Pseudomonadota bacterium]NBP13684.1 single-stranded DNA-binding protein [bacterium]